MRWKDFPGQGTGEGAVDGPCVMTAEEVSISGQVLTSITGLASSIEINYVQDRQDLLGTSKRLSTLDVKTGSFQKTYSFDQDYFSDNLAYSTVNSNLVISSTAHAAMVKKLRLNSIACSGGTQSLPSYEFEYYNSEGTKILVQYWCNLICVNMVKISLFAVNNNM